MIPLKLQIILIFVSLVGLIYVTKKIIDYKLQLKYSLLWFLLSAVTLSLAIFPDLSNFISKLTSIETPVNVLFLFGILISFLIQFSLTAALSNYSLKIKDLSQEVGILMLKIENLERKHINHNMDS